MKYYIPIFFFVFTISCSPKEKKIIDLSKEIMAIHDESMIEHGKIFKLRKNLLSQISSTNDSILKETLTQLVDDLDDADKGMMDWMHTYKAPEEFLPYEERLLYLENEKKKISTIRDQIHNSIIEAEKYKK